MKESLFTPEISVVLPAYNEAANLEAMIPALLQALEKLASRTGDFEIVVVDDGSTDQSLALLRDWSQRDPRVRYLSFARNHGQVLALVAGLRFSRGRAVITMDADFQHPLEMLSGFLESWRQGSAIVNTLRMNANGFFSVMFYRVFQLWTGIRIQPGFADFRLFDRRVVDYLCQFSPEEIFLRGLIPEIGFAQTTLRYHCEPRRHGTTKYTFRKNLRMAFNGLVTQASVGFRLPFYLAGACPLLACLPARGAIAAGFAAVLLVLGVFGIYFRKSYLNQVVRKPAYFVKESSEAPSQLRGLPNRAAA